MMDLKRITLVHVDIIDVGVLLLVAYSLFILIQNVCSRVFIRHPKNQAITAQDLSSLIDPDDINIEVFHNSDKGPTDLSIISGNVEILIGKNEWYLYIAKEIWKAFNDNYLESKLANSYK